MVATGEFADKVVLVVGAGKGLGRKVAEAFADQEAIVAINDITPINLDETLHALQAKGVRAKDYICDIAKKMMVQTFVADVLHDWGHIDILVNCASVHPRSALLDMDEWEWHRTLDVNLTGAFILMQTVGRVMRQQKQGVIVNVGAHSEHLQWEVGQLAFAASKMGVLGLTQSSTLEMAEFGVRVNAVCTGVSVGTDDFVTFREKTVERILFLCSEEAANLEGRVMCIDCD